MAFGGPETRLSWAVALVATLAACGSDPPEAKPSPRSTLQAAAARPASPAPLVRPLAIPVSASTSAAPLEVGSPPVAKVPAVASIAVGYPPKDDCAKLPGFATFRDALFAAVRKRDAAALAALADPAVNLDFGGGSGPAELRKRLEAGSALWEQLSALEDLGCAEDGGVVTMPWIFSRMPDAIDPYSALLVTGAGVPLRARPSADAKELAKVDWVLVEAVKAAEPGSYREVTSGKLRGFVEAARLRSVIDYRLIADRQNGEWKVTAFVAGD